MTTFPALVPSSRTFTPGEYPATAFSAFSGAQNRVRHSNVFLAAQLRLSFLGLSQAQMLDIWNHYNNRRGEFRSFDLPAEVVSYGSITDYVPGNYLWRYAGPGSVEDLPCGGHNVSLTLETVPPTAASVVGADLFLMLRLKAGAADGGEYAPGINETITLSVSGGDAFTAINGLQETIALSLSTGEVFGDGLADGISEEILLLFLPGLAKEELVLGIDETITLSLVAGEASGDLVDPEFASVALLLHMDGSNGSTSFTDSSSNALTVSVFGDAQVSTSSPKFGSGSLLLDGTGDYLRVPDDPDWDFGTGDFTVEAWINMAALDDTMPIVGRLSPSAGGVAWGLQALRSPTRLFFYAGAASFFHNWTGGSLNTWHHVAVTRSGTTLSVYANGSRLGSGSNSTNLGASTSTVRIGTDSLETLFFNGKIDDVRVTKGIARYTGASYTVPTAAFPDS
jgi:hypothetical protein